MLILIFSIMMAAVFGRLFIFSLRCAWGIGRVVFTLLFLPLLLILAAARGLISLALPVLVVYGLVSLLRPQHQSR
ncbi:MAG: hypothetical protein IJM17_07525 [Firmicutes bacterium]|nr:hypothetical protein [Bacillota bacterium]